MITRNRLWLSLFRNAVFFTIVFGFVPVHENRPIKPAVINPQTSMFQFSMSVQEVLAKKNNDEPLKYCWKCTCPYHADGNKKRKGTWADEGYVETDNDGRGAAESDAHEKCERQATGKDCYFGNAVAPVPRGEGTATEVTISYNAVAHRASSSETSTRSSPRFFISEKEKHLTH